MNKPRWIVTVLVIAILVLLGLTAAVWVPLLLTFVNANTDTIQGLTDLVQLLLWIGAGIVFVLRLSGWLRTRQAAPAEANRQHTAEVPGSGASAQGDKPVAAGQGGLATQSFQGLALTGDQNLVVLAADATHLLLQQWQASGRPPPDLGPVTERYLAHLLDRYRFLEFKGMGVTDRLALQLPLVEMYVPLKARIELPKGETWTRELRLAGRTPSKEEAEAIGERVSTPQPLFDLLRQHQGLIILGDPGAGKTTFLKYLTLLLAAGKGPDLDLAVQLPVLVPLSAYATVLATRNVTLKDFIPQYYRERGIDLPIGPLLDEALARGSALVLLDGLDEVRALDQRLLVMQRVLDFFTFQKRTGNRFILTSRIVGYREVRPSLKDLGECTLVDFDDDDITQFVEKWTLAVERAARGDTSLAISEAGREREELLDAIHRNPGVHQLASNPLLLTILALMKRQGVTLPERRVELYQKYVETLVKHWNLARSLDRSPSRDLDMVEMLRILAPLALWMHETSPGVGLVKREALRRRLVDIYTARGLADPEQLVEQFLIDAREHAGLLVERGPNEYGFIHLTFQEYLAAAALGQQAQQTVEPIVKALSDHIRSDSWHEVSLLTIGYVGIVQQRDEAAGAALAELIARAPGEPGQAVVLAGDAVIDAWPGGVTPACRQHVSGVLRTTMRGGTTAAARWRAAAGATLGRLGDDERAEVLTIPGMQFCYVPAGRFWMGSGDKEGYSFERPQHSLDLPAYWIGRYPVTNAQYAAFMQAGGYTTAHYWQEALAAGYWREDGSFKGPYDDAPRREPGRYREPFGLSNHPVVGVTWYEALAFSRWLSEQMGQEFRLPNEPEWEKTARGGEEIVGEPVVKTLGAELRPGDYSRQPNPAPRRVYAWEGTQITPELANYSETRISSASAVGCFPAGASPYGAEEMAGNVWEWTRSLWSDGKKDFAYPYDARDGREKLSTAASRVLRGGSWYYSAGLVRCAFRHLDEPWNRVIDVGFRLVAPGL